MSAADKKGQIGRLVNLQYVWDSESKLLLLR
jgi:hypothetical protein